MAVATRPRALTSDPLPSPTSSTFSTTTPRYNNFRPLRYQTKEELDRFFGSTSTQRREQRLRVRESDGQVYYDVIEKDEWAHLLASGSSEDRKGRRRSSAVTCLTLNSPLRPASPRRESSASESATGCVTPLVSRFGNVLIDGDGTNERRGRKRSNSALAPRKDRVDDEKPLSGGGEHDWVSSPAFKRRQSDFSPRNSIANEEGMEPKEGRIRISRLPLGRRKLDKHTLDQAFGVESNPLFDLSPNPIHLTSRAHKPATLQIPSSHIGGLTDPLSPTTSTPPRSPISPTYDGSRRGTFGPLSHPMQRASHSPDHILSFPIPTSASLSSAGMEYLVSPAPTATSGRTLRHASSFDSPRTPSDSWGQRQRWHSADESHPPLRGTRSVASLRSDAGNPFASARSSAAAAQDRRRKGSSESDGSGAECFTALAPRLGAKRFDPTRFLDLDLTPSVASVSVDVGPMRDPLSLLSRSTPLVNTREPLSNLSILSDPSVSPEASQNEQPKKALRGTGLRTGAHVYDGIDIPCASIHLHSDPEDNLDPATVASLSSGQIRKLKKKAATNAGEGATGHVRRGSEVPIT
ncbi:hypothetical protein PSEUBRA_003336 [Kalmanozyma brasiliensis GHG001]|uniref:Uncharacterized protein n=1 Tax=Kalmanozyma brasiliensis (strain GHG001) TaxID=1365824 RepID=V5EVB8_KALBG|nr:uncharacterized protein PSEUBRA_003336 [Kalmanozyma brasiliensis GHG001]EST07173.1 hypothetical protein PSEUBRA_003336 [Kalmanozyma brasiliensis GHG001]